MNQLNAVQVWKDLRGIENACRYHSDLLLGLMDALPKREESSSKSYSNGPIYRPSPVCIPPGPCLKTTQEARESLQDLSTRAEAAIQNAVDLIGEAERLGITDFTFRSSQFPSYTEGSGAEAGTRATTGGQPR